MEVKIFEFVSAAFAHCLLQRGVAIIRKELEWMRLIEFLSHKEQRRFRREQQQGRGQHAHSSGNQRSKPLTLRPVSHLVMILDADHMRRCRHSPGTAPTRTPIPEAKWLTLKNKAFIQRAYNLLRLAEILVIAFALAGKESVNRMMKIIAPYCVQAVSIIGARSRHARVVLISLGNHTDLPPKTRGEFSCILADLRQDMFR